MIRKIVLWLCAFVITITAAIYQRMTGPTYPLKIQAAVNGQMYELRLVRSLALDERPEVKLSIDDTTASALLFFRRYPSDEPYRSASFEYQTYPVTSFIMNRIFGIEEDKGFFASIPQQPAAGKIQYYFQVTDNNGTKTYMEQDPVILRFKGSVPSAILIPHVLIMFMAMMLSTLAGLYALTGISRFRLYTLLTLILLAAGGMILGPLVQQYAFGQLWTGIPFGWDLTDNKTLIAFLGFLAAVLGNRKKVRPWLTILAAILLLIIFSIPHSLLGSELNYESVKIIQGILHLII